jgi:hypothetical protein
VTLRARWGTLRARWVTLRACWVTFRPPPAPGFPPPLPPHTAQVSVVMRLFGYTETTFAPHQPTYRAVVAAVTQVDVGAVRISLATLMPPPRSPAWPPLSPSRHRRMLLQADAMDSVLLNTFIQVTTLEETAQVRAPLPPHRALSVFRVGVLGGRNIVASQPKRVRHKRTRVSSHRRSD